MDPMTAQAIASVGGTVLGGIFGSKKKTQTVDTTPDLYKGSEGQKLLGNVRTGFDALLNRGTAASETPISLTQRRRVAAPTNGFEALFAHPEMMQIQRQSDASYFDKLFEGPTQNAIPAPAGPTPAEINALRARQTLAGMPQITGPSNLFSNFQEHATEEDWAELGAKIKGAQTPSAGMYAGGFVDPKTGRLIDVSSILNKYRR
jgi:hypothetical protein